MIIPEHKLLFIHVPRTGGTSIERYFGKKNPINFQDKHYGVLDYVLVNRGLVSLLKFAFVRNPWDRVVSIYEFLRKEDTHPEYIGMNIGFNDWVQQKYAIEAGSKRKRSNIYRDQCYWVTDRRGNIAVDFVGRFERLQDDFTLVCASAGVPRRELGKERTFSNPDKHYTEYYSNQATRDAVTRVCRRAIELFEYEFDDGQ